ncbi:MAG: YutD family protein [Paenibacillaceae bacterium]|uniref:YutD family protein n=1 Tax=Paenibacillus cymbidii TaxID=1639034 RepID=UPI001081B82E|nr:YutD family protein [Paenibacillus cymbidii]MBO9605417.1 YutD family protein [Paenibacillaceae bacterium]
MIVIGGNQYEVMQDHKNGWNPEAFRGRFSEVLERYDYIVGDWGYSQLRLRGFFKETNPKATKETSFAGVQDYLHEYCNFGCAYFILEKSSQKAQQQPSQPRPELAP